MPCNRRPAPLFTFAPRQACGGQLGLWDYVRANVTWRYPQLRACLRVCMTSSHTCLLSLSPTACRVSQLPQFVHGVRTPHRSTEQLGCRNARGVAAFSFICRVGPWQVQGAQIRTLPCASPAAACAWAPDSTLAVLQSNGAVVLWNCWQAEPEQVGHALDFVGSSEPSERLNRWIPETPLFLAFSASHPLASCSARASGRGAGAPPPPPPPGGGGGGGRERERHGRRAWQHLQYQWLAARLSRERNCCAAPGTTPPTLPSMVAPGRLAG